MTDSTRNPGQETPGPIKFPPWVSVCFFSATGIFAMILRHYPSLQETSLPRYPFALKIIASIGPGWFVLGILFGIMGSLADLTDARNAEGDRMNSGGDGSKGVHGR